MNITIKIKKGEIAYRQIERAFSHAILSGELTEGERLPSEVKLANTLGISRMTVNKAMNALSRRGLIRRSRGKGSYVAPRKPDEGFFRVMNFDRYITEMGMIPSTKVLEATVCIADEKVVRALQLSLGDKVIKARRLHMADKTPLMLEIQYLNASYCYPILNENLSTGSIHEILVGRLNLPLARVQQALEIRRALKEEADLLRIREGDCCFYMIRTIYTYGKPISWVHYLYRSDRYRFEADFNPVEAM